MQFITLELIYLIGAKRMTQCDSSYAVEKCGDCDIEMSRGVSDKFKST